MKRRDIEQKLEQNLAELETRRQALLDQAELDLQDALADEIRRLKPYRGVLCLGLLRRWGNYTLTRTLVTLPGEVEAVLATAQDLRQLKDHLANLNAYLSFQRWRVGKPTAGCCWDPWDITQLSGVDEYALLPFCDAETRAL